MRREFYISHIIIGLILKVIPLNLFLDMMCSFPMDYTITGIVWMFCGHKNAYKTTWAVHVSIIGLAIS